jgi:hypothetical protein
VELLVNSIIGMVILIFDVGRGLLEWSDQALLSAAAMGTGAYLGTRIALAHYDRTVRARVVAGRS